MVANELLCRLHNLRDREQCLQDELAETRYNARYANASILDGMPSGSHDHASRVEKYALKIVRLEEAIANIRVKAINAETKIYRFICTAPDSKARLLMVYRFVDLLSWEDIAQKIGNGETAENARKYCCRYLKKMNSTKTNTEDAATQETQPPERETPQTESRIKE